MFWKISKVPGNFIVHLRPEHSMNPISGTQTDLQLTLTQIRTYSLSCPNCVEETNCFLWARSNFLICWNFCSNSMDWQTGLLSLVLPHSGCGNRHDWWTSIRKADLGGVREVGPGPAKKPYQLECGRCLVEAFGCWQEIQPARQNTHHHRTQSCAKSEFVAGTRHWWGPKGPMAGQRRKSRYRPTERIWPPTVSLCAVRYWYQVCFLG